MMTSSEGHLFSLVSNTPNSKSTTVYPHRLIWYQLNFEAVSKPAVPIQLWLSFPSKTAHLFKFTFLYHISQGGNSTKDQVLWLQPQLCLVPSWCCVGASRTINDYWKTDFV